MKNEIIYRIFRIILVIVFVMSLSYLRNNTVNNYALADSMMNSMPHFKVTELNNNIDQKLEEIKLRKQNNFNRKARELNQKLKLKDEHIKKTLQLRRLEKEEEMKKLSETIKKRFFSVQETLDRFLNEQEEQRLKQKEETETKCNF